MTIEEVKNKLPDVKILIGGHVYKGYTAGRKNKFAMVVVNDIGSGYQAEFSWEAITRHVNNPETPLIG